MKTISRSLLTTLLTFATFVAVQTHAFAEGGWMTDYDKALAKAKTENKRLLLDFTGSDWCGWCMKLDKEVFKTREFKEYAEKNLVLVEVDFPQEKHQTKKLKEKNKELSDKFGIKGYPTIVVLDKDGNKIGEAGYMEGGPGPFVAKIDGFKAPQ